MSPREINAEILRIRRGSGALQEKVSALEKVWREYASFFNAVNISSWFHSLAVVARRGTDRTFRQCRTTISVAVSKTIEKLDEFNPQALANTIWACARLGFYDEGLLLAISQAALRKIDEFKPQDFNITVWACAMLRFYDEGLLLAISQAALRKIDEFKPQDLAITIWSCARLGFYDEGLLLAISQAAVKKIDEFDPQNLSNTIWACAVLGFRVAELDLMFSKLALQQISAAHLTQVYQASLEFEIPLPALLQKQIEQSQLSNLDRTFGAREDEVADFLRMLGMPFSRQQVVEFFQLDFLVKASEGLINIELDGPHHYLRNTNPFRLVGGDELRDRILAKRGITVIRIPLNSWKACASHNDRCQLVLRCWKGE